MDRLIRRPLTPTQIKAILAKPMHRYPLYAKGTLPLVPVRYLMRKRADGSVYRERIGEW